MSSSARMQRHFLANVSKRRLDGCEAQSHDEHERQRISFGRLSCIGSEGRMQVRTWDHVHTSLLTLSTEPLDFINCLSMSFSATCRCVDSSTARYTDAKPPCPRRPPMRYSSMGTRWVALGGPVSQAKASQHSLVRGQLHNKTGKGQDRRSTPHSVKLVGVLIIAYKTMTYELRS